MTEEKEFKLLDSKIVGNDKIVFRLENGAQVIVRVDITRAGIRINEKGDEEYHFDFANSCKVIPSKKTFKVTMPKHKEEDTRYIK
jgi:hypothetical protein